MHQRTSATAGTQEIHNQVERLSMEDGGRLEVFSSRRRARENKDSRTDDRADAERCQRPWPQRLAKPVRRILRLRNQFVDGLATEGLSVGSADHARGICRLGS